MPLKQKDGKTGASARYQEKRAHIGVKWRTGLAKVQIGLHRNKKKFSGTKAFYLLAEFFYQLGFGAEYTAVRVVRGVCGAALLAWRLALGTLGRLGRFILREAGELWHDLTGPVTGVWKGVKGIYRAAGEGRLGGYLWRGALKYLGAWGRLISYALPAAAALLFAATVRDTLAQQYALAVECNGQVVGYVADELVFDAARDEVKSRIVLAKDKDWDVNPTFALAAAAESVMDVNGTADAILRASADEIQQATGLEVDGVLVAITTQGDRLREYFESKKARYIDPEKPDMRVEFVQDIQTVDGLYATDSISDYSRVLEKLEGETEQEQIYTIQAGDSPTGVASRFDLTSAELAMMNPKIAEAGYNWPIGDTLVVHQSVDFLQVKTVETVVEQHAVDYAIIETKDPSLDMGKKKTTQEGVEGLDEVTYELVSINGVPVAKNEVQRVRLADPIEKHVLVGSKKPAGIFGTGHYVWPVPGYRFVSRWMSAGHKGTDIAAPAGTPILAADSGVVIKAGWNAAGSGYGNSVVIQHGPGNTTLYAHASYLNVYVGQTVSQGQVIGGVGNTGNSYGNHLHFEIRENGALVNARVYFPGF